jgi:uncharacterized metal-binding protein
MSEKIDACSADRRMDGTCCAEGAKTLGVLACSGGSNVGQVANKRRDRHRHKTVTETCIALPVSARHYRVFIECERAARTILFDGCRLHVARRRRKSG